MSLDALFRPASVAIIGASSDPTRIGGRPVAFSKRAFKGAIIPINPKGGEIQGLPAYASIADAPGPIDQAIIAVPAKAALAAADACIAKGVPLDLHPKVFKPGDVATTLVAYIGVQIDRIDETFQLTAPRSMAGSFWSWLAASAAEFGYDLTSGVAP